VEHMPSGQRLARRHLAESLYPRCAGSRVPYPARPTLPGRDRPGVGMFHVEHMSMGRSLAGFTAAPRRRCSTWNIPGWQVGGGRFLGFIWSPAGLCRPQHVGGQRPSGHRLGGAGGTQRCSTWNIAPIHCPSTTKRPTCGFPANGVPRGTYPVGQPSSTWNIPSRPSMFHVEHTDELTQLGWRARHRRLAGAPGRVTLCQVVKT
jgi:hypothetical protein